MLTVRLTKAEAAIVRSWMEAVLEGANGSRDSAVAESVLAKLRAAVAPTTSGVAAGPLEAAMVAAARGKVVQLVSTGAVYGRVSKQATAVGATVEDAEVIGEWLARQGWLREPVTILTALSKWPDWLARARATAAPGGIPEGLDGGNVRSGTSKRRAVTTAGRRSPGLG